MHDFVPITMFLDVDSKLRRIYAFCKAREILWPEIKNEDYKEILYFINLFNEILSNHNSVLYI